MTASIKINSHTDINGIEETRAKITLEGGVLSGNKKNIDRQTHTHLIF